MTDIQKPCVTHERKFAIHKHPAKCSCTLCKKFFDVNICNKEAKQLHEIPDTMKKFITQHNKDTESSYKFIIESHNHFCRCPKCSNLRKRTEFW